MAEIAPSPGFARPPEGVRGNLGAARPFVMNAPSPGFARPPEGVRGNLGAARPFLTNAPSPGFARPPEGVRGNLGAARPFLMNALQLALLGADMHSFMALDFGTRRTGVAYGSRLLGQARPLATIHAREAQQRLDLVGRQIAEWQPQALVVGIPLHPDGAEHENTLLARKFARTLRNRFKLPVFEVDERYSTTEALSDGARDTDAGAACVILEQFLRSLA